MGTNSWEEFYSRLYKRTVLENIPTQALKLA